MKAVFEHAHVFNQSTFSTGLITAHTRRIHYYYYPPVLVDMARASRLQWTCVVFTIVTALVMIKLTSISTWKHLESHHQELIYTHDVRLLKSLVNEAQRQADAIVLEHLDASSIVESRNQTQR